MNWRVSFSKAKQKEKRKKNTLTKNDISRRARPFVSFLIYDVNSHGASFGNASNKRGWNSVTIKVLRLYWLLGVQGEASGTFTRYIRRRNITSHFVRPLCVNFVLPSLRYLSKMCVRVACTNDEINNPQLSCGLTRKLYRYDTMRTAENVDRWR